MEDRQQGWYETPGEGMRYWDGDQWTSGPEGDVPGDVGAAATTSNPKNPARSRWVAAALVTALVVVAATAGVIVTLFLTRDKNGADAAVANQSPTPSYSQTVETRTPDPTPTKSQESVSDSPSPQPSTQPKPNASATGASKVPATQPPKAMANFDEKYAKTVVGYIVDDIGRADEYFMDSPELGTAGIMGFLAEDMTRLEDAGVPPVSDPAEYVALVRTLSDFYSKAETQLPQNVPEAAATYTVARRGTSDLLKILNPVLGTNHKLPTWKWM